MLSQGPAVHCIVVSRNSGYVLFQGGGWQPTLQPFLQERKHYSNRASSGVFLARRTPGREQTPFQCVGLPCWRSSSLNDGLERQGLSRGWGSGDTAGRYLLAVYRGAMPTSGPGSAASAEVVSYEAIQAAWLQLRMPYAPGASETVSVVPHSCLWRNSGNSALLGQVALGPVAEQKQNETEDSPPSPPPGEGAALFSPSPEKEQTPTSPGGAALLREARRTGLCVDSAWGGAALEDAGGRPRRRADWGLAPGAEVDGAWGGHLEDVEDVCIMQGQDVLDRLGLLLYRRELLGEALDGVTEQPSLGDGGVEKACLVDVLHLCQVEPEMALLDHHGGHRLPEGPRRDFRRS